MSNKTERRLFQESKEGIGFIMTNSSGKKKTVTFSFDCSLFVRGIELIVVPGPASQELGRKIAELPGIKVKRELETGCAS